MSEKKSTSRYRNFATVVYPDSAPTDWLSILDSFHIPVFVSPLHDKDINPTGEPKKPHYHVMVMYDSVKTVDQAKELFSFIFGVGCEVISSIRGYARYLCHLDNPDKVQYDPETVTCLAGADYFDIIGLAVDKYKCIAEIVDFCLDNDIYRFCDLFAYARNERFDWFRVLCDNTYAVKELLISRRVPLANVKDAGDVSAS